MVIQEPVQAAIWHCLNHYAYPDAIFLAERLYAELASEDALFLLATCYYRAGKAARAYTLLQNAGCPTAQCRFLMAQCCLDINKLSEAEVAITGSILHKSKSHEDILHDFGETSSFALRLLAKIYSKTERTTKAAESYRSSLKQNPFLWSAFESLCNLGENPEPSKSFHIPPNHNLNVSQSPGFSVTHTPQMAIHVTHDNTPSCNNTQESTPLHIPPFMHTPPIITHTPENVMDVTPECVPTPPHASTLAPTRRKSVFTIPKGAKSAFGGMATLSPLTPSFGVLPLDATPSPTGCNSMCTSPFITPPAPPAQSLFPPTGLPVPPKILAKTRRLPQQQPPQQQQHSKPPVLNLTGNTNSMTPSPQPGLQNNNGGLRRSSRLFNASSSVKENNKNQGQKKYMSPKAPTKKSRSKLSKSQQELNEINKSDILTSEKSSASIAASVQVQVASMQRQSADGLMRLLQDLGRVYLAVSHYDCKKAIQHISALPPHHHNTGWVLCQLGRAYFEMGEYQKADKVFTEARQLEPHHMEGMEYYSTALWHLQKEVSLSHLAQELTELDKDAPEAWFATGSCFSLQKEHDVAIKFFQRAVQVDPDFAYAYTLLGHEYVSTEELDKAMACFRNATRVDPRHYNAWYGVGMIFHRQEKFALAEVHFRKALSINPQSSALLCHIGVVQHALKRSEAALGTLDKAIATDTKNPLCKFHRASILFANDRHKEALKELEELKEIVPKESLVYFLIGKVHKKLGNTHLALMNFSWAMDLDPKGANNQIKEAIDKRYVTEEDDPTAGLDDSGGLDDPLEGSNSSLMEADDIQLQAVESDESL